MPAADLLTCIYSPFVFNELINDCVVISLLYPESVSFQVKDTEVSSFHESVAEATAHQPSSWADESFTTIFIVLISRFDNLSEVNTCRNAEFSESELENDCSVQI
ncbi:hypothetical protein [uncultured Treponema sp.]|uniref:hypothetical protein n=1 Tax=uncultured Treponema sp. TaxID=162155 RepID=UPI000E9113BB|nr:hypothetical protein [uncultured Treponema sp.]HAZ96159.1 hypothetical protein [Treponema sp.]